MSEQKRASNVAVIHVDEAPGHAGLSESDKQRVLRLAHNHSVLAISRLPGFPDAATIYRDLKTDPAFGRKFAAANRQHKQDRQSALVELISRATRLDEARVLIALRRLRKHIAALPDAPQNPQHDLTLLSDDELQTMEAILRKAAGIDENSDS